MCTQVTPQPSPCTIDLCARLFFFGYSNLHIFPSGRYFLDVPITVKLERLELDLAKICSAACLRIVILLHCIEYKRNDKKGARARESQKPDLARGSHKSCRADKAFAKDLRKGMFSPCSPPASGELSILQVVT